MASKHIHIQNYMYSGAGTSVPIQEEGKGSEYIHVYGSTTKNQVLMEGNCMLLSIIIVRYLLALVAVPPIAKCL